MWYESFVKRFHETSEIEAKFSEYSSTTKGEEKMLILSDVSMLKMTRNGKAKKNT